MSEQENTIKFAWYVPGWTYSLGAKAPAAAAIPIRPSEYEKGMGGSLFCPECSVPLFRSPLDGARSKAGVAAFFAHSRRYLVDCRLRTPRSDGKLYSNEEEARQAVENGDLVILKAFAKERPSLPEGTAGQYDRGPVEDPDGELARVPISRHRGETFELPSQIETVVGLCRNFDKNYYKFFYLPKSQFAAPLGQLLVDVATINDVDPSPKLYFGRIKHGWNFPNSKIRKTVLDYEAGEYRDFCLKLNEDAQAEKGITEQADGRVVVMYGSVSKNGTGLCIKDLGYGEFGLLPEKYEYLLYDQE